ncbi:MAG: CAP domain-containing protein [Oscillospiraceae bacterium]|nr:CAP domain-containing protein [Oscillospiraceae bacterium]
MKRLRKIIFLTLAAVLILGATPTAVRAADPIELRVLELVNEERAERGLDPLIWSDDAYNAALIRAAEVLQSFSHTRTNNTQFSTVFAEVGIRYTYAAENIAYGYTSAESVVEAWMNSAGHRANILSTNVKYMAVAVRVGGTYSPAWAQEFYSGTPAPSAKPGATPAPNAKPSVTPAPSAKPGATPVPSAKPGVPDVPQPSQLFPDCTVVVIPSGSGIPYESPRYQPPEWDRPSQAPQQWYWIG